MHFLIYSLLSHFSRRIFITVYLLILFLLSGFTFCHPSFFVAVLLFLTDPFVFHSLTLLSPFHYFFLYSFLHFILYYFYRLTFPLFLSLFLCSCFPFLVYPFACSHAAVIFFLFFSLLQVSTFQTSNTLILFPFFFQLVFFFNIYPFKFSHCCHFHPFFYFLTQVGTFETPNTIMYSNR